MSEEKNGIAKYNERILASIVNNNKLKHLLFDKSRYSYRRPMFDDMTMSELKLSTEEKYKTYISKTSNDHQRKYGDLNIKYKSKDLPLAKVADFIGDERYLLEPFMSQEYFAGVDKLRGWNHNLFTNKEFSNMHDVLEAFNMNTDLLPSIKTVFSKYMLKREKLERELLKIIIKSNLPSEINLIKALSARMLYTKKRLFGEEGIAPAAAFYMKGKRN